MVHNVGLGDYQHDFEYQGEFDPWLSDFWGKLEPASGPEMDHLLPSIYKVEMAEGKVSETLQQLPDPIGARKGVYLSKVKSNERITSEGHF